MLSELDFGELKQVSHYTKVQLIFAVVNDDNSRVLTCSLSSCDAAK